MIRSGRAVTSTFWSFETDLRRLDRDLDLKIAFAVPIGIDILVVTPPEFTERLPQTGFGQTILHNARQVYAA